MEERHVVTCFLEREGRVLVPRRGDRVRTYRGRWAGVSGYLEPGTSPREQALRELYEETGLRAADVQLVREGVPLRVQDEIEGLEWVVHPFRFRLIEERPLHLDWESVEMRWILPEEIGDLETVPGLAAAWQRVAEEAL